jgi:hypothetical protein
LFSPYTRVFSKPEKRIRKKGVRVPRPRVFCEKAYAAFQGNRVYVDFMQGKGRSSWKGL